MKTNLANILFVDDDPNLLRGIGRSLQTQEKNWNILFAESADAALDIFKDSPIDVLVSDLAMPGMNGLQLVTKINKKFPETVCVILSGTADMASMLDAINVAKVFRFYTKPTIVSELVKGIESALAFKTKASGSPFKGYGSTALDELPIAVVVVDENYKSVFTNRAGAAILADGQALSIDRAGVCRAREVNIHAALRSALNDDHKNIEPMYFVLPISSELRPLSVIVNSFGDQHLPGQHASRLASMFIFDPNNPLEPSIEALKTLFGFTPAEANLTASLTKGLPLEESASECGITISSARTYLKRIFSKTGTSRQGELIKLVLTSVPINTPTR